MRKKIFPLIIIISLIIITFIFFKYVFKYDEVCKLNIQYKGITISIEPWYSDIDNKYYVFVPSFSDVKNLELITNKNIRINDKKYNNMDKLDDLDLDEDYTFINGEDESIIRFVKAKKSASMFIDTASKSLEKIHENKDNKEKGRMTLINEDGEIEYYNNLKYIKGRGNTSWRRDKRPYNIKLSKKADLLGMGEAKKWALLANIIDRTHIRNKIVFDFSQEIGLDYSPNSEHVHLYINSEYKGLYLLCEKTEIATNRVDIDTDEEDITGPYLIEKELEIRYVEEDSGFITGKGDHFVIKNSSDMTPEKEEYIKNYWQNIEDNLYEQDDDIFNYLDLESWTKKYLIEEIFGNFDANNTSTFFYKKPDSSSNLIYAGPVWDYDGSCGVVCKYNKSKEYIVNIEDSMWNKLMQFDTFRNTVIDKYNNDFKSNLNNLINNCIDELSEELENAISLDDIRWQYCYDEIDPAVHVAYPTHEENVNHLKTFLKERMEFLNSEWKK